MIKEASNGNVRAVEDHCKKSRSTPAASCSGIVHCAR